MPAKLESLPLREALLAFSDPLLAERWRETKQEFVPPAVDLPYKPEKLARLDAAFLDHAKAQNALRSAVQDRQRRALNALHSDFLERVASGEVVLEGLQIAPTLAVARSVIPAVWSKLLLIWGGADRILVGVQGIRFMDVTVFRPVPVRSIGASHAVPISTEADTNTGTSSRPRGRESYEPLIEADLQANWDEVQRRVAKRPEQRPNWSELARAMHKRLVKGQRSSGGQIPHMQTIRTRLPDIYARLLSENPVRK